MNENEIAKLLDGTAFFADLEADDRRWLAGQVAEANFTDGQLVVRQGDRAEQFFLILDGCLEVEIPAISGPSLKITRLGPGKVFGWSWLIEPYRWHFNARAAGATRMLDFDGRAILARAEAEPNFGYALLRHFSALMGTRLESAQRRLMEQWAAAGLP